MPKQPTPRKGTETRHRSDTKASSCRNNLHPARGRKLGLYSIASCFGVKKQPTPRKGTETQVHTIDSVEILETIYTPQGDGNPAKPSRLLRGSRNNLHPARGRKSEAVLDIVAANEKKPPREGTETPLCQDALRYGKRKQPTPREGTETRYRGRPRCRSSGNNPHPARGRKFTSHFPSYFPFPI